MPTAYEMNRKEWRVYHPSEGLSSLEKSSDSDIERRKREALEIARKASGLLKTKFGATKVVVFGSLAHDAWFNPWSDIDLASWGILPETFYSAVAAVTGLSPAFRIDLVDGNDCKPAVKKAIEKEGIEI